MVGVVGEWGWVRWGGVGERWRVRGGQFAKAAIHLYHLFSLLSPLDHSEITPAIIFIIETTPSPMSLL